MSLIEVRKDLWLEVSVKKEEMNSEETLTLGSKVHFLHNYHGSFFHDEVKTSLP